MGPPISESSQGLPKVLRRASERPPRAPRSSAGAGALTSEGAKLHTCTDPGQAQAWARDQRACLPDRGRGWGVRA
eukprot:4078953-Pyramimonas_sp.AAC.1